MAATTTKNNGFLADLDAAAERVRETNDRIAEAGRKLTIAYLDGVERYATGIAGAERKLSQQSQVEAVSNLLTTHAELTENLVKASVSATRELIAV